MRTIDVYICCCCFVAVAVAADQSTTVVVADDVKRIKRSGMLLHALLMLLTEARKNIRSVCQCNLRIDAATAAVSLLLLLLLL